MGGHSDHRQYPRSVPAPAPPAAGQNGDAALGKLAEMPHLLAAPDKWRGSATAAQVAATIVRAAVAVGWTADAAPVSDGGEGFAAVLGGRARPVRVHGPLGDRRQAPWYLLDDGVTASIEMALASGLALVGGSRAQRPDPGQHGRHR